MFLLTHYSRLSTLNSLLSTLDAPLQLQARNVAPSPLTDNALATQPTKWMKYCCLIKIVWNKSDDFHFRFRFGFRFRFLYSPLLSSPLLLLPIVAEKWRRKTHLRSSCQPRLGFNFRRQLLHVHETVCEYKCVWMSEWRVCVCVWVLCTPVAPHQAELPKIGQDSFTCLESFLFATLLALLGKTSEIVIGSSQNIHN